MPADRAHDGPTPWPADVAMEDWDALFSAVKSRLRLTVRGLVGALPGSDELEHAARVQAGVLDCVAALDQLHATLLHQRQGGPRPAPPVRIALAPEAVTGALLDGHRFREHLAHALAADPQQSRALAVLGFDDGGMPPERNAEGHPAHEAWLELVRSRLGRACRAGDVLGRAGPAEFACLLHGVRDPAQLGALADTLHEAFSVPMRIGEVEVKPLHCIGIAIAPRDGLTTEALFARARDAVGQARQRRLRYAIFERRKSGRSVPGLIEDRPAPRAAWPSESGTVVPG
jgi:GGDEF domain-containing protein